MAKEKEGGDAKPKEGKKIDFKKILTLVFLVANLSVTGGGAYLVFASTIGYHSPKIVEEEENKKMENVRESREQKPIYFHMEKFTVNLDGVPRRIVQAELSLEMLDEEGFEEVVSLGAEARDSIIRILNRKTYPDIETLQGKLLLKDQIASTVNGFLKKGIVKEVYFSTLVVQ